MKQCFKLGLTGSIGVGKSTTATMFRSRNIPVWDADKTVHDLYKNSTDTILKISKIIPNALINGKIEHNELVNAILDNSKLLLEIEKIIYPTLEKKRIEFINKYHNESLIVFDIPLIFEKNLQNLFDAVLVVFVDYNLQKQRAMQRSNMTEKKFKMIKSQQISTKNKCKYADYIIKTDNINQTRQEVDKLIIKLTGKLNA